MLMQMKRLNSKKFVLLLIVFITFSVSAQKISTAWLDSLTFVKYTNGNRDSINEVHNSVDCEMNIDTLLKFISEKIESKNEREQNEAWFWFSNVTQKIITYPIFLKVLNFYEDVLVKDEPKYFIDDYRRYIGKYPEYAKRLDTLSQCKINTVIQKYPGQLMDVLSYGILDYGWRAACCKQCWIT